MKTFLLFALVAMASGCLGFVTAGLMAGAKVADLERRLHLAERQLARQMAAIEKVPLPSSGQAVRQSKAG